MVNGWVSGGLESISHSCQAIRERPMKPTRATAIQVRGVIAAILAGFLAGPQASATGGLISGLNVSAPAQHLTIVLDYDSSVNSAPAGFKPAMVACATTLSGLIVSPATIHFQVGWGEAMGATVTGAGLSFETILTSVSSPSIVTYTNIRNGLIANAKSANALQAVSTLPVSDPAPGATNRVVHLSHARQLGMISQGALDVSIPYAWIGFSSGLPWNYTQTAGPSEYDIVSVCLHEATETMGRLIYAGATFAAYSPYDYFRYASNGTRQFGGTAASPAYFSINSGTTDLRDFTTDNSADPGDWVGVGPSPFDGNASTGPRPLTSYDTTVLQAIGYDSQ